MLGADPARRVAARRRVVRTCGGGSGSGTRSERASRARIRTIKQLSRREKRGLFREKGGGRVSENSRLGTPGEKASRERGGKARSHVSGRGSTAAAHVPPLFLGLASRANVFHEVLLGQRRGDGAGLRDRGDDARRPAMVPGRHAEASEGRIGSPGRTYARRVRQARGRCARGIAHVRRVASSSRAEGVDGRAMNVRWVERNASRRLSLYPLGESLVLFRLARKTMTLLFANSRVLSNPYDP